MAIGKRGQNVRLAAHVTNCKIDIKSEEDFQKEMAELDALVEEVDEIVEEVAETGSEEATTEE